MKVAVLQLSAQGVSSTKLLKYIRIAHKNNVSVLLLGEYILNPFFKELQSMTINMIQEQSQYQMKILKELAKTYNIVLVAPIIVVKNRKIYKAVVKFAPHSTSYYYQQVLINYPHWNEEVFFDNDTNSALKTPLIFKVNNIRFAILYGYELHFDKLFSLLDEKNIDCLLVPSISTFDSFVRWKKLIEMRSFTHNIYILRANRIGEFKDTDNIPWSFYGDSLLTSPEGETLQHLGNKEELMICDIFHREIQLSRKRWKFLQNIKNR